MANMAVSRIKREFKEVMRSEEVSGSNGYLKVLILHQVLKIPLVVIRS